MFGRKKKSEPGELSTSVGQSSTSDHTLTHEYPTSNTQIKRATRTRLLWSLLASFLLLVSVVFVILVELGNTSIGPILNNIYFIKLNLTNILATAIPGDFLVNSIAQTLGLHDFYTVGLWNFCEGYNGEGVTMCSSPQNLYWFNPVAIIQSQLLAGATIALPAEINTVLDLIRVVSHFMFALFLTGACLSFVLIFLLPLSVYTRWGGAALSFFTFLTALFTTVATVIATVMFIIMKNAITSVASLNIRASLGTEMFVFMWIAAITSILAWLITMGMCCCCASRRDVRTGRKRGSKKAYLDDGVVEEKTDGREKKQRRGLFGRGRKS